jgi:polygalacturonase
MSLTKASYSMISGSPINVLDYGADPTGVSSSSAAFQAAVTAVGYGGAIFIPEGTYKFNATVNVPPTASLDSAINFFGNGGVTIIQPGAIIDSLFYSSYIYNR